jgi:DNA-binding MarR family transcriptional regulator
MNLDPALSTPARIAILLFLMPRTQATFPTIQKALGVTSGNLSSHLKKLDESEFIIQEKKFVDNKPMTVVTISSKGHQAIVKYVTALNSAIEGSI